MMMKTPEQQLAVTTRNEGLDLATSWYVTNSEFTEGHHTDFNLSNIIWSTNISQEYMTDFGVIVANQECVP